MRETIFSGDPRFWGFLGRSRFLHGSGIFFILIIFRFKYRRLLDRCAATRLCIATHEDTSRWCLFGLVSHSEHLRRQQHYLDNSSVDPLVASVAIFVTSEPQSIMFWSWKPLPSIGTACLWSQLPIRTNTKLCLPATIDPNNFHPLTSGAYGFKPIPQ